jgi:integrase
LPPVQQKHLAAIINPKEVGHLLMVIDAYQGDISIAYAMKILPYTFVRSGELRAAEWAEIDLDRAEWIIPAGRMKMRQPHVVPLARQVVELFTAMREHSGHGKLVFPSPFSATRCISDMGLLNALRRMGYEKGVMTIHGFRGMASTLLNEQGYRPDVIEVQLAHGERNAVRKAYNHAEYLPERRKMMSEWADYLDGLRGQS